MYPFTWLYTIGKEKPCWRKSDHWVPLSGGVDDRHFLGGAWANSGGAGSVLFLERDLHYTGAHICLQAQNGTLKMCVCISLFRNFNCLFRWIIVVEQWIVVIKQIWRNKLHSFISIKGRKTVKYFFDMQLNRNYKHLVFLDFSIIFQMKILKCNVLVC